MCGKTVHVRCKCEFEHQQKRKHVLRPAEAAGVLQLDLFHSLRLSLSSVSPSPDPIRLKSAPEIFRRVLVAFFFLFRLMCVCRVRRCSDREKTLWITLHNFNSAIKQESFAFMGGFIWFSYIQRQT